ncbi:MAG: Holliday junction resolvase RuvX [Bacteroidaceae bacterium]|jgi:putative Holliday junction resolvase|nr:Holliday junction resolvase RuvX [Bacteroidaceae bacterium]
MSRILAIDYGQKRTGIAVTDTLQMIANGLATIETKELERFIVDYVAEEDVSVIVVGKPTQMNGENSENMKRIEPFFNRLKKLFPDKEITYYDERFTSVLAHQAMLQSGIGKKARQDKGLVDKISATIILEDYLQSRTKTPTSV